MGMWGIWIVFEVPVSRFQRYRSQNTKPPELVFRALLADGASEVRFERVVG
jgi:hypothetical protein